MSSATAWAGDVLATQAAEGLLRSPIERQGGSARHATVRGRPVVVFSSNDYVGLAADPRVRQAAAEAALASGVGATGSRLLSGSHQEMAALEAELCAFEGGDTATLAPSGYQANLAILQALGGPDASIFSDELNHASIIDGCRLSRGEVEIYSHNNLDDLSDRLDHARGRPIIVSDTVFSMDGDVANARGLAELAESHGAWLVLDEAHATGVLGPGGRGLVAEAGIGGSENLIRVVTLSKALGASGAAIVGSRDVRQLLLQRGRASIFSTALPLPIVAAARAALQVLVQEPERVRQVQARSRSLRQALLPLNVPGRPEVPIVPVVVGAAERALAIEQHLLELGYLAQGVRPPTVAPGSSRIRLVPTVAHTQDELEAVATALRQALEANP
jgi:8-amino-7-oxononanoate synthase